MVGKERLNILRLPFCTEFSMTETDVRKLIDSIGERIDQVARTIPVPEARESLQALRMDLGRVLTVIMSRIEKLEEQPKK